MDQLLEQLRDPSANSLMLRLRAANVIVQLIQRLQSTAQPLYTFDPTLQDAVLEYKRVCNEEALANLT